MKAQFVILSGSSNRKLALTTAGLLGVEIGKCSLARFPDTEVNVQLNEPVRGRWVFILQSSSPPLDEHVMEVFAIADACRRAGAAGIGWIAPYFGYARQRQTGHPPERDHGSADRGFHAAGWNRPTHHGRPAFTPSGRVFSNPDGKPEYARAARRGVEA